MSWIYFFTHLFANQTLENVLSMLKFDLDRIFIKSIRFIYFDYDAGKKMKRNAK